MSSGYPEAMMDYSGPSANDWCLYTTKEICTHDTQGDLAVKTEAEISDVSTSQGTPGEPASPRSWKRPATDYPSQRPEDSTLPTPRFRASALQSHERINFCCFKHQLVVRYDGGPRKPLRFLFRE
uniref:Uncharacterized protein n=1 Tax=Rousettus aegyptiacus TaxID=9407 RepID=A0A7J8FIR1_ROUAE|nr:hypothetical protein HJG63_012038 [Rousettus aegyptiacus]